MVSYNSKTQDYSISERDHIDLKKVLKNMLAKVFILIMKDEFFDLEEIKTLAPVREEAIPLFIELSNY
jgi:hypothetical protein